MTPYNDCLKPCQGLYVDVKKDPVEIVQVPQYQLLMKEYENYTWFQNDIDGQSQSMIGESNTVYGKFILLHTTKF